MCIRDSYAGRKAAAYAVTVPLAEVCADDLEKEQMRLYAPMYRRERCV